ncbi:hypothetical protein [Parabacteroides merdae]|jgi:hypothetical protein|uniref:hypothetical protein n=1 Tax=Parabacteroides merdae TaxID=46503 RepID=UPI0020599666|nr:MAG TPA: Putative tail length tape measure protein [Caudoviricetes sp.]
MADLITRLLLNTQQFDNNLGKSTKQIQGFQQKIQGFSSGAVSAFTKFAGVLGVAYGATELLQKGLNSNATLQDKYNSLMQAGSTVTDQFFTAIYSGDWTVFNDGIEKAIKNAKEYADTYRNVQRMLETTSIKFEQTDARKTQLEAIIEDDTKPLEERKKAQQELDRILLMGVADIREASQITERELNNMLADLIGEAQYITTENAQKLILDIRNKYSGLRKELDAYREVRDTKNQVMNPNAFKYSGDEWYKINQDATKKYYQEYTKDQRAYYDELLRLADRMNDETFSSFQGLFDKLNDLNDKAGTWEKDRAGARDEIAGIKTTASKKEIIPAGSIMEMQKKIADLRKKYENAADEGTRVGFMKAIKEAETELKMMQLRAAGTSLLPTGEINKPVGRNIADDVKSGYINIKPISTDSIQANYDYADSLGAIASIMGSVTNMTNEGAAGWLAYGANILSSISAAIPMITSLTTALTAKAAAEAAGSAAAVPVVGWINAVAAITAIMSAMAAVPKFADGGIIGGNSFIGDNMIARVNSGEMILNNRQQRNLFNLLDGKGGTSVNAGGEVKLRIEGRDLVGVINSQTSKTSKYK